MISLLFILELRFLWNTSNMFYLNYLYYCCIDLEFYFFLLYFILLLLGEWSAPAYFKGQKARDPLCSSCKVYSVNFKKQFYWKVTAKAFTFKFLCINCNFCWEKHCASCCGANSWSANFKRKVDITTHNLCCLRLLSYYKFYLITIAKVDTKGWNNYLFQRLRSLQKRQRYYPVLV